MKTKKLVWVLAAVGCLGLLGATVARAEQNVLDLVPDDAFAFVVINHLGQTDAKVQKVVELAELPLGNTPLEIVKMFGGIEKGLDEKGALALAVMPNEVSPANPKPVVILPVSDYEAFLGNFDPEKVTDTISRVSTDDASALVAKKGDYALFVEVFNQDLLESLLADKKSIAPTMGPWQAWIKESDAVVVLSGGAVKLLVDMANNEIDNVKAVFEIMGEQGAQATTALETYQKMLGGVSENLTYVGVGALVEKDHAVRLTARGRFKAGCPFATRVKGMEVPPGNRWTGIANKPFALAAAGSLSEGLVTGAMQLSKNTMSNMPDLYELDEEQMKKLADLTVESMKDVQGMSMHVGMAEPGEPIYQGVTAALRVKDSEAFLEGYAKLIKAMADLAADSEQSPLTKITCEPIDVDGHKGLELAMDLTAMYDKPELAMAVPLFKAMYGPEGKLTVYLAAADKTTVAVAYLDKNGLTDAIKAAADSDASLAADPGVAEMMKRLPADAQWAGLWSPSGTLRIVQQAVSGMMPEGMAIPMPEMSDTPPIGFAVQVSGTKVKKDVLIPIETLKQVAAVVRPYVQMMTPSDEPEMDPEVEPEMEPEMEPEDQPEAENEDK